MAHAPREEITACDKVPHSDFVSPDDEFIDKYASFLLNSLIFFQSEKNIIECKIKDAGKRKVLSNILRELILVSEHEDFNVIDMILSYLITGVANYNKNAAQIVKDAFADTGEHFAVVLSLFFNTVFVQFDKVIILSLFNSIKFIRNTKICCFR